MFECKTDEDQQNKIYVRYLEFCNLRRVCMERIKFSYNYKKNTMRVEAKNYDKRIEFDIDDFIDWERIILIIRV
jgi:uncharacterized protein YtpQ (UPF0354 family)